MMDYETAKKAMLDVDEEAFDRAIVDTFYSDFDGYEAMKGIEALILNTKTAEEYNLIDRTLIALLGSSIETLLERASEETNEVEP